MPLTTRGRDDRIPGSGMGRMDSSAVSKIATALDQKTLKILIPL
jgi:hypothetical protein